MSAPAYPYFSHNGTVRPIAKALVPLSSLEVVYSFGVYETVRVRHGEPLFLADHSARLLSSARIISLEHPFSEEMLTASVHSLVDALLGSPCPETYNLKILLYGAPDPHDAQLYILASTPHYPSEAHYRDGIHAVTVETERPFPHAKSLNMLPSYLAYREAKRQNAYDALLVNRRGEVTEGTRTNLFAILGSTLISPPTADILLGVTRTHVIEVAARAGLSYTEQPLPRDTLYIYDALFLTSTSSKILPIRSVDSYVLSPIPPQLRALMKLFVETYYG